MPESVCEGKVRVYEWREYKLKGKKIIPVLAGASICLCLTSCGLLPTEEEIGRAHV